MRTISWVADALAKDTGVRWKFKLVSYMTHFSGTGNVTVDRHGDLTAQPAGINLSENRQDLIFVQGFPNPYPLWSNFWGVYNQSGTIYLSLCDDFDDLVWAIPGIQMDPTSRPALVQNGVGSQYVSIFYIYNLQAYRTIVDLDELVTNGPTNCVVSTVNVKTPPETQDFKGCIHAISETCAVVLALADGGVEVYKYEYITGQWVMTSPSPRLFIVPDQVLDESFLGRLNYSDAVKFGNVYFVYFTMNDGTIHGISLNEDGDWSDFFVAIPQDNTKFLLCNAFSYGSRVIMCGQFYRNDTGSGNAIYNLLPWSVDGRTFSLDRFIGVSQQRYRLQAAVNNQKQIMFGDTNRYFIDNLPFSVGVENAKSVVILDSNIVSIRGDLESTVKVVLANGEEIYDNPADIEEPVNSENYLLPGTICDLFVGTITNDPNPGDTTWVLYQRFVVVSRNIKYPSRMLSIDLMQAGLWGLSNITYPFYLEINSKSSNRDDITDFEGGSLASLEMSTGIPEKLVVDFWDASNYGEGSALSPTSHAAGSPGSKDYTSGDLLTRGLSSYPIIESLPIQIDIYGWSRTGIPTFFVADDPPVTDLNDDFLVTLIVKQPNDTASEREVVVPIGNLVSSHSHPPQYWKPGSTNATGSYPVSYSAGTGDGLLVNDKIISIKVTCQSNYATVQYIERVEIPAVDMLVSSMTERIKIEDILSAAGGLTEFTFLSSVQGWWHETPDYYTDYFWVSGALGCQFHTLDPEVTFFEGYWHLDTQGLVVESGAHIDFTVVPCTGETSQKFCQYTATVIFEGGGYQFIDMGKGHDSPYQMDIDEAYVGREIQEIVAGIGGWRWDGTASQVQAKMTHVDLVGFDTTDYSKVEPRHLISVIGQGQPVIFLAARPYTTFNFEAGGDFDISGDYSEVGVIGLATDVKNYIAAVISETTARLIKVRNGVETQIYSTSHSLTQSRNKLLLTHKDGCFAFYVYTGTEVGDPVFIYNWHPDTDGVMVDNTDIMHIGIYSIINPPHFRVAGYQEGSLVIPLLTGYPKTALDDFPTSGTVLLGNKKYTYTSKMPATSSGSRDPSGPFQLRAGSTEHKKNPSDNQVYTGSAWEITNFKWQDNPTHHEDWTGYILADNNGRDAVIKDIDYKPWVTQSGTVYYLKNRMRIYVQGDTINTASINDKCYLTHGLLGIVSAGSLLEDDSAAGSFTEGTYCFLYAESNINIYSFWGSSENSAIVIEDIIQMLGRMAGVESEFPGDFVVSNKTLTPGQTWFVGESPA